MPTPTPFVGKVRDSPRAGARRHSERQRGPRAITLDFFHRKRHRTWTASLPEDPVSLTRERTDQILRGDLNPEYMEAALKSLAWGYDRLYEELAGNSAINDAMRHEQFGHRRGTCAIDALLQNAKKHGVPYDIRRLDCNGQNKLLVRMVGRLVLMQEPILSFRDDPRVSDYKIKLANLYGMMSQLELNLGDGYYRNSDWAGCILSVLLHGAAGPRFTRDHKNSAA